MQVQNAVVMSQSPPAQKVFTSNFQELWTDCFNDGESCIISTFCPCVQYGKNYVAVTNPAFSTVGGPDAQVSQQSGACVCACLVYAVGLYFCGPIAECVLGGLNRGNLRAKYGITTGDCADGCSDLLIHCCCTCCALSQEWRELRFRADQPMTIAVPGGVIVGTQVQSPGIVIQQPGVVMQPAYAQPVQGQFANVQYAQQPQYAQQQPQQGYYAQPQQQQGQYYQPQQQQGQYYQPQQQQQYPQQQTYAAPPQSAYPQQQTMQR